MTTKERTNNWLQRLLPQNTILNAADRIVANIYHESVLHMDDALQEAENLNSPLLRRITRIEAGLAQFIISLRPGLQEYIEQDHTRHPRHRYQ